jgi:plasmid stabilization system protein ParE
MVYRVKIMPRAQRDLGQIYKKIEAATSGAAAAWYWDLKHSIARLKTHPLRCPITPESKEFRHLLYGQKPHVYRVIYRVLERQRLVEILHIRHGAMDKFKLDEL